VVCIVAAAVRSSTDATPFLLACSCRLRRSPPSTPSSAEARRKRLNPSPSWYLFLSHVALSWPDGVYVLCCGCVAEVEPGEAEGEGEQLGTVRPGHLRQDAQPLNPL
jgi:hypothetical protein